MKPFQSAPQLFQFAFIARLLPLRLFERLQHPFHFIQHLAQLLNDVFHILNSFVHRRTLFPVTLLIVPIVPRWALIRRSAMLMRRLRRTGG
jgi:hypothetical protein